MTKSNPIDTDDPAFRARAERRRSTWNLSRYNDVDAVKDAEYAYWATQPTHVVMATVAEMTAEAYASKSIHVSRLQRPYRTPEPS